MIVNDKVRLDAINIIKYYQLIASFILGIIPEGLPVHRAPPHGTPQTTFRK